MIIKYKYAKFENKEYTKVNILYKYVKSENKEYTKVNQMHLKFVTILYWAT